MEPSVIAPHGASLITLPKLVVLDTSHLAGLAADWTSPDKQLRLSAQSFVPSLIERGWVPLVCWHQVEELLQHRDDQLVDGRLRCLWSWPMLAWVRSSDPNAGLGTVVDLFRIEALAAHAWPDADVLQVSHLARDAAIAIGTPTDAIPDIFRDWRQLRQILSAGQEHARKTVAITRWDAAKIGNTQIADWLDKPLRESGKAASMLEQLRNNLANEIATRGDKRIVDPQKMANGFISEVSRQSEKVKAGTNVSPAIQFLLSAGMDIEDIDLNATLNETMDLHAFHQRLRIIANSSAPSFSELKRTVTPNRVPVTTIERTMRDYGHDQPERKGSDLNDVHLLCLAPYADMTYVDKRTLESVRRAKSKDKAFSDLVGNVSKASSYHEILATIDTLRSMHVRNTAQP